MAKAPVFGVGTDVLKNRLRLDPAGAYMFFGEEEYLKEYYLGRFRELVNKGGFGDFNYSRFDFEGRSLAELEDEISFVPMGSELRLVEVRSLKPQKLSDKDAQRLLEILRGVGKDLILIIYCADGEFVCDKASLKKKFPHQLAEALTAVNFTRLSEAALVSWITKGFNSMGLDSTDRAARALVRACLSDMLRMRGEIDKLAAYLRSRDRKRLEEEDVRLLVHGDPDAKVYELTDAVLERNAAGAANALEELRALRTEPIWIISALAKAIYSASAASSGDGESAAASLGMADWQLRSYREKGRAYDRKYFAAAMDMCLECDRKLKSSGLDADALTDGLVFGLIRLGGVKGSY